MKIGIHDAEKDYMPHKSFPNYALMKISAYHKALGDTVTWWDPMMEHDPMTRCDAVYSSKVFDFTPENMCLPVNAIKGGTGYDVKSKLKPEIESMCPDYSIYRKCNDPIGFITRGCPNKCRWCVVPEKEGDIAPYRDWREIVRQDSENLILMDNNILAIDYGIDQLQSLIGSGYAVDLNQGMDARLVTPEIAEIISRLSWIRHIRFSCDSVSQIDAIMKTAELLKRYGVKPYRMFIYLLITPELSSAMYRVEKLKKLTGINLYAQAERNDRIGIMPNELQLEFANRYVFSGKYRRETWKEYCRRHGINGMEGLK